MLTLLFSSVTISQLINELIGRKLNEQLEETAKSSYSAAYSANSFFKFALSLIPKPKLCFNDGSLNYEHRLATAQHDLAH